MTYAIIIAAALVAVFRIGYAWGEHRAWICSPRAIRRAQRRNRADLRRVLKR